MDRERIARLLGRLGAAAATDRGEILAELRAATSLDWGDDLDAWRTWWTTQQQDAHRFVAPTHLPPPRLSAKAEATHRALQAMGFDVRADDLGRDPDLRSQMIIHGRSLWLPDASQWSYYVGSSFADRLRTHLSDLDVKVAVEVREDCFVITLKRWLARTQIAVRERPRERIFEALSAYLAKLDPPRPLWLDDQEVAWRVGEARVAIWQRHGGPALSRQPTRDAVASPPPRLEALLARVRWLPELPGPSELDAQHDPDEELDIWVAPITAWLARAGVKATCTVDEDEYAVVVAAGGARYPLGPFEDAEIAPEDLAIGLAKVIAPDEICVAIDDPWSDRNGWLLMSPAEHAKLVASGIVTEA